MNFFHVLDMLIHMCNFELFRTQSKLKIFFSLSLKKSDTLMLSLVYVHLFKYERRITLLKKITLLFHV